MPVLDFKGKSVIYSHHLRVPFRSLKVDEKKSCFQKSKAKSPTLDDNLIIQGDNLHALKALLPRYAGKVKCIYIDPPYNTGNEGWKYNDRVNSPVMNAWLSQNSIDKEDLERHEKWLCMMWPRLQLLKELLTNDGVIFVSIDSNEQHHLRTLMDEIFGEDNFIADFTVIKSNGGGRAKQIIKGHDYVLVYSRCISFFEPLKKKNRKYHIDRKLNKDGIKFCSVLKHFSTTGVDDIKEIGIKFDYPKPVSLIRELILGATFNKKDKDSIILDSFAGSGTTAHAVLDLNKEDGGNRQFILIECEDYADKITAERVRRVIKGVPKAKAEKLKKGLGGSFTYYKLGEEININNILKDKLPNYKQMAKHLFWTGTGKKLKKIAKANPAWFIGESGTYKVYLIYRPDISFFKSKDSFLNENLAKTIKNFNKSSQKTNLVFAPEKYITHKKLLKDYNIEFCHFPYEIYKFIYKLRGHCF